MIQLSGSPLSAPGTRKQLHMNLRDLAETACIAAWYGPYPPQSHGMEPDRVEMYWRYFRFRERLWECSQKADSSGDAAETDPASGLFEEVLVSELLTRVVAGVIWNRASESSPSCTSARSIADRTVARHNAYKERLLSQHREQADSVAEVLRRRRLQRRLERWCDLLVSSLIKTDEAMRFAYDAGRCREFAREGAFPSRAGGVGAALSLYAHGLRRAVPNKVLTDRLRREAHGSVVHSALKLMPESDFREDGLIKPRWQRLIEAGSLLDSRSVCIRSMHFSGQ